MDERGDSTEVQGHELNSATEPTSPNEDEVNGAVHRTEFNHGHAPLYATDISNIQISVDRMISALIFAIPARQHPLHDACRYGNLELVRQFVDNEANINARGPSGVTPLEEACWNGQESIVEMLIGRGAYTQLTDWTPLRLAIVRGHKAIVKLLLKKDKTNINVDTGFDNKTPLILAIDHSQEDIARLLLEEEADANQPVQKR